LTLSLETGNLENLKGMEDRENYTFVKADICDKEAISKIFAENDIDRVVHFAAESHVDRSVRNPELFVQTNVLGTVVIINIIIETLQEMLPEGDARKALVSTDLITYVEDRKGHDRRYAIAPDKIKAEIGWYPETMFKEGIKKTIKWFFENEDWMKNVTSGDYQKYYTDMYEK